MQEQLVEAQEAVAEQEVDGVAGGGAVRIAATRRPTSSSGRASTPPCWRTATPSMVEDLVLAALHDVVDQHSGPERRRPRRARRPHRPARLSVGVGLRPVGPDADRRARPATRRRARSRRSASRTTCCGCRRRTRSASPTRSRKSSGASRSVVAASTSPRPTASRRRRASSAASARTPVVRTACCAWSRSPRTSSPSRRRTATRAATTCCRATSIRSAASAASSCGVGELIKRIEAEAITEMIVCTNPNIEGEATALYVAKEVRERHPDVYGDPHRQRPARRRRPRIRRRTHPRPRPGRPHLALKRELGPV